MIMDSKKIIEILGLKHLPDEGGYYRETYRTGDTIDTDALPARYHSPKSLSTAIYYLLTPDTCSLLHRLPADEIFHFYLGDPVAMLRLYPDMTSDVITLGPDIGSGQCLQVTVPHSTWQGSYLLEGGNYALMGTTMAPGFDFSDYEGGSRDELSRKYPKRADIIKKLTLPD